jgi:hypothetical protein
VTTPEFQFHAPALTDCKVAARVYNRSGMDDQHLIAARQDASPASVVPLVPAGIAKPGYIDLSYYSCLLAVVFALSLAIIDILNIYKQILL